MTDSRTSQKDLLHDALKNAPCGAVVASTSMDGEISYVNEEFTRITGYVLADVPTVARWLEIAYPDPGYRATVVANWEREVFGPSRDVFYTITTKDGGRRELLLRGQPLSHTQMVVMMLDVSAHAEVQRELRESEGRYRNLIDSLPVGVAVHVGDRIVFVNRAAARIVGYADPEDVVGRVVFDMVHPEYRERTLSRVREILELRRAQPPMEERFLRADGSPVDVEVLGTAVEWKGSLASQVVFTDITERKESLRKIQESEQRFRELAEAIDAVVWVVTVHPTARYEYVSPAWETLWGQPVETLYADRNAWIESVHEADRPAVDEAWTACMRGERRRLHLTYRIRRPDGDVRWIEDTGVALIDDDGQVHTISGIAKDMTDRVRAEEEQRALERRVQRAQKLESLGIMAGGVAHDFNNLLVGILGNAELALGNLPARSPVRSNLMGIEEAARSAADLARQLLAYSGKGRFVVARINLSRLIEEMSHLLDATVPKKIVLRRRLPLDIPPIEADATQIRQVVMNLVTNAAEAIGEGDGVIEVSTGAMECDRDCLKGTSVDAEAGPGRYACLEVVDTGAGMDRQTQERIFDPFFSTKFTGRGLGLAAVQGIVRGHGGTIIVHSELGEGTTFKVLFPTTEGTPEEAREPSKRLEEPARASGTVLLVDDEPRVREVATIMLRRAGFEVLAASDGREALSLFSERSASIDVVVLDLEMPHMSGEETFTELRRVRPDVEIVLSSGYSEQDVVSRFAGKSLAGFLQKPYRANDLVEALRTVTSGRRERA